MKPNTFKNVYAKDADAKIERLRTHHLNDDAETEIESSDVIQGTFKFHLIISLISIYTQPRMKPLITDKASNYR